MVGQDAPFWAIGGGRGGGLYCCWFGDLTASVPAVEVVLLM